MYTYHQHNIETSHHKATSSKLHSKASRPPAPTFVIHHSTHSRNHLPNRTHNPPTLSSRSFYIPLYTHCRRLPPSPFAIAVCHRRRRRRRRRCSKALPRCHFQCRSLDVRCHFLALASAMERNALTSSINHIGTSTALKGFIHFRNVATALRGFTGQRQSGGSDSWDSFASALASVRAASHCTGAPRTTRTRTGVVVSLHLLFGAVSSFSVSLRRCLPCCWCCVITEHWCVGGVGGVGVAGVVGWCWWSLCLVVDVFTVAWHGGMQVPCRCCCAALLLVAL